MALTPRAGRAVGKMTGKPWPEDRSYQSGSRQISATCRCPTRLNRRPCDLVSLRLGPALKMTVERALDRPDRSTVMRGDPNSRCLARASPAHILTQASRQDSGRTPVNLNPPFGALPHTCIIGRQTHGGRSRRPVTWSCAAEDATPVIAQAPIPPYVNTLERAAAFTGTGRRRRGTRRSRVSKLSGRRTEGRLRAARTPGLHRPLSDARHESDPVTFPARA